VWRNFKHVVLNDTPVDFVMCLTCSHVVTFKKKDGTKGMHAHKCGSEEPAPVQRKMTSFVERHSLPQPARESLTTELIKFVACDMRPYSSVDGTGFKSLCQTLVNFGARYGQFDVTRELPDRTSLARHVPDLVEKTKNDVKSLLATSEYIALTSDGWTDDFRKVSYVTVTAHFFDNNLHLQSCILDTGSVDERKTAEVLGSIVTNVSQQFGFSMNKVTIVTDNASNMVAAFRDRCCRLSCFAHCLNLVVTEMLAVDNDEFKSMLACCKTLVRHFKHTGLQRQLKKTLKQDCPTRWNSTFSMMESVLDQYDAVHELLNARKELRYLYAVDTEVMKAVVCFLTDFRDASEKACADKAPTLHLVAPMFHRLLTTTCADADGDCSIVLALKGKGRAALQSKVRLDVMHDVAAFLNPCMKGLGFIPPARKKAAMEFVNKLLREATTESSSQEDINNAEDDVPVCTVQYCCI